MAAEEFRFYATTEQDTTEWAVGKKVIEAFLEVDERLVPETLYQWEDKIGPYTSIEQTRPYWAQLGQMRSGGTLSEFPIGLRWKRNRVVKYDAEIQHTDKNCKGEMIEGRLNIYAKIHKKVDWLRLSLNLINAINPRVGAVHYFTKCEQKYSNSEKNGSHFDSFVPVNGQIPNVGWGMYYGGEFAKEVDEGKISKAGFPIRKIGNGYFIQVTNEINDVLDDFQVFSTRRAYLKSLFRDGLFRF